jgi:hypothetical protein
MICISDMQAKLWNFSANFHKNSSF